MHLHSLVGGCVCRNAGPCLESKQKMGYLCNCIFHPAAMHHVGSHLQQSLDRSDDGDVEPYYQKEDHPDEREAQLSLPLPPPAAPLVSSVHERHIASFVGNRLLMLLPSGKIAAAEYDMLLDYVLPSVQLCLHC